MLMATGSGVAQAAGEKSVVILSADGSQRHELLSDVDRIQLGAASLTLTTVNGKSETVDYKDIDRILIGAEWTAVKELTHQGEIAVWPTATTDIVNVSGLNAGDIVTVTDLKGAAVASTHASGELASLRLGPLPAGMYVLTVKNKSVKIIKK